MFVGRHFELEQIIKHFKTSKKEFIAITGKRGVGKTELLIKSRDFLLRENGKLDSKNVFIKLVGKKGLPLKKQLKQSVNAVVEAYQSSGRNIEWKDCNDWQSFFDRILIEGRKLSEEGCQLFFFIDEFPWLNTKGSYFVEEIGAFWNFYNLDNLKIIITGSAVSWMAKNVFRNVGGLYHKVTFSIHLKAFDLLETAEYLLRNNKLYNSNEIVEYYLMTGGIPRYLQNINHSDSLETNRQQIYNQNYFIDFFNNSFSSNKQAHEKVVELFSSRIKLSFEEIRTLLKVNDISSPTISDAIEELIDTDILVEVSNYNKKKNVNFRTKKVGDRGTERKTGKSYVLADLFFFNYLRKENPSNKDLAFEVLALNNMHLFLNGKFRLTKWNGKQAQIDWLAEYETKNFSLIECKYYNQIYNFNHNDVPKIINRIETFKKENDKKRSFFDVMFISMWGTKNCTDFSYKDISIDSFLTEKTIHFR